MPVKAEWLSEPPRARPLGWRSAAIGAVAGSVGGIRGRINAKREAGKSGAQQAVQTNQQALDQFKMAASVCLEGRGYTVR